MKKSKAQSEGEKQLRSLQKVFEGRGIHVRREKLCAGPAFKVKSGDCFFSGERIIFVDLRLSSEQQLSVLIEYLIDAPFELSSEELNFFSASTRDLILSRRQGASQQLQAHAAA